MRVTRTRKGHLTSLETRSRAQPWIHSSRSTTTAMMASPFVFSFLIQNVIMYYVGNSQQIRAYCIQYLTLKDTNSMIDQLQPCQRRWKFELPNHYITGGKNPKKVNSVCSHEEHILLCMFEDPENKALPYNQSLFPNFLQIPALPILYL